LDPSGIQLALKVVMRRLAVTLWIVVGTWSCGDMGSSPVPQPIPDFVRLSTPALKQTKQLVVGLPGAVDGEGKVHLGDKATGRKVSAASPAAGSFALAITIDPTKTKELELRFENEDGLSDPVTLPTTRLTYGPTLSAVHGPGLVSAPDSKGEALVDNDAGAGNPPLVDATPDMNLIVTNFDTGAVKSTKTDNKGLFSVRIPAAKGDLLQILLVDPTDPGSTSDFITATVP
jgi:hypothetical protein